MNTSLNTLIGNEHIAELGRFADQRRHALGRAPSRSVAAYADAVSLRLARSHEADVVRRIAALDDAPMLEGRLLLALINDQAVAALSLPDGRVVANPFVRTDHAVSLLRMRADHLLGVSKRSRRRAILRLRFA